MQELQVRSLGQEDPLEKEMATHSSILAWQIPWTDYSPWGCKELDTTEHHMHIYLDYYKANFQFVILHPICQV